MKVAEIFRDAPGKRVLMSGNEAFARGIYESGVRYSANYPGTPLSEVGDYLKFLSETTSNFTFDYSLNEKVALESCIGASWAGVRSVVMFKHIGLNVAADPLHSFPYSGVNGGMLILCGGDPGILSSTNAQDNRLYSLHTKIPIIEPATIQECKDFIKKGLRISELFNIPIYLHVTTRLCHSYGIVTFGELEPHKAKGFFEKDPDRYINTRGRALTNQKKYFEKIGQVAKSKKILNLFNFIKAKQEPEEFEIPNENRIGILTSGSSYSYVIQACHKLEINPPILKLGLIFPINREDICHFANQYNLNKLLIVEELEPFIETFSKSVFCNYCDAKRDLSIHGKDYLSNIGELNTEMVIRFLTKHIKVKPTPLIEDIKRKEELLKEILPLLPIRDPTFCSGCPYRPVFYALKKAIKKASNQTGIEFIYGGDIGCYTLSEAYPYQMLDWVICMGAGIGIANGIAQVVSKKQKLIAFIGDSTLFHTGIQALLNAIKNNTDIMIIIFYNYWTSMTGQQEHIATPREIIQKFGKKSTTDIKGIDLINLLESIGLEKSNLIISGAYNIEALERIFSSTLIKSGTRVVVINEECALEKKRRLRKQSQNIELEKEEKIYYTLTDSCTKCNECIEHLGCPAINAEYVQKEDLINNNTQKWKGLKYYIDENACIPDICPGICKSVCKNNSIKKTLINPNFQKKSV